MDQTFDMLRSEARSAAARAHVPYSGQGAAAVLLLADDRASLRSMSKV